VTQFTAVAKEMMFIRRDWGFRLASWELVRWGSVSWELGSIVEIIRSGVALIIRLIAAKKRAATKDLRFPGKLSSLPRLFLLKEVEKRIFATGVLYFQQFSD